MPSPDRPNSGGADSKYFIGLLKDIFFFELKNDKFYFLNAYLNSIQHILLFPSTKKLKELTCGFNPIQDGHFRGCSRMWGQKGPPSLKSITHILQL